MTTKKIEKFIKAPVSEVYHYFTSSTALKDWMCDVATTDAEPGGRLYLCWPGDYYTSGEYLKLEKEKLVSFSWLGREEPHKTRVDVTLNKQRGGTLVKLAHRGIGKGQKWEQIAKGYETEWKSAFENLASVLETGADLRITRRPMLGIYISDYNPEIAAKLGVPVEYGTRLSDVIDGMGAQKAGLMKDDVIVALDDHELIGNTTLVSIISKKHAGDVVDVAFYRGAEKKNVKMTLSGRPLPPIPTSSQEFAWQIGEVYHDIEKQIEEILNSASEAECSHHPAPGEWSVKEVLAHLIQGEEDWQSYTSEIIMGNERSFEGDGGNLQALIDASLEIFPTKAELFKELKTQDAKSISLIEHTSEEFFSHKGRLWKLAYIASQNPYHTQIHLDQMRAAVKSARK